MKERPIIFSAQDVRAILAGTKTQTRRVVVPGRSQGWLRPELLARSPRAKPVLSGGVQLAQFAHPLAGQTIDGIERDEWSPLTCVRCPYGRPGDRLWVREAWAETRPLGSPWPATMYVYAAGDNRTDYGGPWRSPIHMPRRASRIRLEVTGVRVERLQGISTADAWAEGIPSSPDVDPAHEYIELWESINGPGSWDANPWVWVIDFKRVEASHA